MNSSSHLIRQKIARLATGCRPRILDVFAGCGGLSLGFLAAGFKIAAAVEIDPDAAASHARNFHGGDPLHGKARDITTVTPEALARDLNLGPVGSAIDVLVGGPPCQAFARVGRSKLREIDAHPEAFKRDLRARLYLEYLRYVSAFHPLGILLENVPDILNHGGRNVAEEICEVLEEMGYVARYSLLNTAVYGVPQMRERMFLMGYRRELECAVTFPEPTHWIEFPSGYEGSRSVALKLMKGKNVGTRALGYIAPPPATRGLSAAITAEQAIGDLPPIDARALIESGKLRRGPRRFDDPIAYDRRRRVSEYARLMQNWSGFDASERLIDHVIRYLPRDYELFARLNPGDQYPEAWGHANAMLAERVAALRKQGVIIREGSARYERLRDSIVPPYDASKFPNKWRKMWCDQPARTLMAHLGKDGYSHIHYDSDQARTISVREAARLQSFPDGFMFCGTMNPAFRQIGNAVPPLMAKAMAVQMMESIRQALQETTNEPYRRAGRGFLNLGPRRIWVSRRSTDGRKGLLTGTTSLLTRAHTSVGDSKRMVDVLTPGQRQLNMSRIRGRDTKPEMLVRRGLHARGLRFRLHRNDLPGCPDLVLPRFQAVIFVHGCFWHGHKCHMFKMPTTRASFWRHKIDQNMKRDQRSHAKLVQERWRVLTVWECALRGRARRPVGALLDEIVRWLASNASESAIEGAPDLIA